MRYKDMSKAAKAAYMRDKTPYYRSTARLYEMRRKFKMQDLMDRTNMQKSFRGRVQPNSPYLKARRYRGKKSLRRLARAWRKKGIQINGINKKGPYKGYSRMGLQPQHAVGIADKYLRKFQTRFRAKKAMGILKPSKKTIGKVLNIPGIAEKILGYL